MGLTQEYLDRLRKYGIAPVSEAGEGIQDDLMQFGISKTTNNGDTSVQAVIEVPDDEAWDVYAATMQVSGSASVPIIYVDAKSSVSLPDSRLPSGWSVNDPSLGVIVAGGEVAGDNEILTWQPARRYILAPGDKVSFQASGIASNGGHTGYARLQYRAWKLRGA